MRLLNLLHNYYFKDFRALLPKNLPVGVMGLEPIRLEDPEF